MYGQCTVVDNGLFTYIAEAIAPAFSELHYWSPWANAFPDDKSMLPGVGLKGIKRANWWLPLVDDADLIVFPDCYYGPDQVWLEKSLGKRVWGSRMAEEMELYREHAKVALQEDGVPIGKWALCHGMDELRKYLQSHGNVVVKFSFTRGDKESFKVEDYYLSEPELDDLEHRLGPRKNERNFIVEDCIDPAIEIAYDGYTIDGEFPEASMWGIEVKGSCYACKVSDYKDIPSHITDNNAKVAYHLKDWRARSWFGMETRVDKKGTPWVIDPLVRMGNPPAGLVSCMYTNLADIFYHGAAGEMVQPEFEDEFGVQLQIYSSWSEEHWQPVYFPPKVAKYVKLQYHCKVDGVDYVLPTADKNPAVGSVVATGSSLDEAIKKCEEYADQIKGPGLKIDCKVLDSVKSEFGKLREYGITVKKDDKK